MQAVRSLARAAPRTFTRAAAQSSRTYSSAMMRSWTPTASAALRSVAHFSSSSSRFQVSQELVAKLEQEITYEQDVLSEQSEDTSIKDYLNASEYQLEDVDGQEEVHLVRSYGDEQIKVSFSTESFSNPESDVDAASDPAMFDEDGRGQDGKVRQAEDEIESDEFDAAPSDYHVSVSIQVSRQGKGAMVIAASLDQDARFNIDHVAYFPTLEMAEGKTAEHELSKRDVYTGPPFEELDEGLQTLFDEYLRERGIDESMGVFIPSYVQLKESKEYMRWMQNVAKFVE